MVTNVRLAYQHVGNRTQNHIMTETSPKVRLFDGF